MSDDLKWLHKYVLCAGFGAPAEDIERARRIVVGLLAAPPAATASGDGGWKALALNQTKELAAKDEFAKHLESRLAASERALADAQAIIDAAHDRLTPASGLEHAEQLASKVERVVSALADALVVLGQCVGKMREFAPMMWSDEIAAAESLLARLKEGGRS